jgi:hypothetical protein
MTGKCAAYWRAKDAGKECGIPETKRSLDLQNKYRNGLVLDLVSMGCTEDDVFEYLPYSVCGAERFKDMIAYFSLKRESPIRRKMIDLFFQKITKREKITNRDIVTHGFTRKGWSNSDYEKHYIPRAAAHCITGKCLSAAKERSINRIKKSGGGLCKRPITVTGEKKSLTRYIADLNNFCTVGQIGILQKMNEFGYGDNEYGAFCIALKWALDRLEQEKGEQK